MNKLNLKSAIIIALFSFSMKNAFSTIVTNKDTANVSYTFVNTDIDKDGLWDFRMRIKSTDQSVIEIELAYTDANNYSAIKVTSSQDFTPVAYNANIDMNTSGTWVNSTNGYLFLTNISDFQSTKYIGFRVVKNNIVYCSWAQVYFKNTSGALFRGTYAWENDNTKCLKTGEIGNTSSIASAQKETNIYVYPNPAANVIFIKGFHSENTSIEVYNLLGKVVFLRNRIQNNESIDISSLIKGIYYIKVIENNKEAKLEKLVVL
jgi:hypothetical protein